MLYQKRTKIVIRRKSWVVFQSYKWEDSQGVDKSQNCSQASGPCCSHKDISVTSKVGVLLKEKCAFTYQIHLDSLQKGALSSLYFVLSYVTAEWRKHTQNKLFFGHSLLFMRLLLSAQKYIVDKRLKALSPFPNKKYCPRKPKIKQNHKINQNP